MNLLNMHDVFLKMVINLNSNCTGVQVQSNTHGVEHGQQQARDLLLCGKKFSFKIAGACCKQVSSGKANN